MITFLLAGLLAGVSVRAQTPKPDNPRPLEHPRVVGKKSLPGGDVPSPEPAKPDPSAATAKKEPLLFRITGADAWKAASQAGWKFTPKGGRGALDGRGTAAQMHPGLNTSMVNGPRMTQMRTPAGWGTVSQNTFLMFADAAGRAKPLAAGWTVRELELAGDPFQWIVRPKPGSTSPFFAIQITGQRSDHDTAVEITRLVLQGPADATNWRDAFAGKP